MTVIAAMTCALGLHGGNTVTVSGAEGAVGARVEIAVGLSSDASDVAAAEIRIPLPDGMMPVEGSCVKNDSRLPSHSVVADMKGSDYVIAVFNTSMTTILSGNGTLATFTVELGDNPGVFDLTPHAVLSDTSGNPVEVNCEGSTLTVTGARLELDAQEIDFGKVAIRGEYSRSVTARNSGTARLEISGVTSTVPGLTGSMSAMSLEPGETAELRLDYAPVERSERVRGKISVNSNSAGKVPVVNVTSVPFSVNELHLEDVTGISDEDVTLTATMNNMEPIVGAEFTLPLPEELDYVDGSIKMSSRAAGHSALASVDATRRLRVVVYGTGNTPLTGDDGDLLTMKLRLNGRSGSYNLTPEKTILSNAAGENMVSEVDGCNVSISSPSIYGDSRMALGAVPLTGGMTFDYEFYNYGSAPLTIEKVNFLDDIAIADASLPMIVNQGERGVIPVKMTRPAFGDFATVMNIYCNDPDNRLKTVEVTGSFYSPNELTFSGAFDNDGVYVMTASLTNSTDIVALQMDIVVPKGMTTGEDALVLMPRAQAHSATVAKVGDGRYRILVFSLSNAPFTGDSGDIFTLGFTGEDFAGSPLRVENIKLSGPDGVNYTTPDTEVKVENIPVPVKEITVDHQEASLKVSEKVQLTATVNPADATDKSVTWRSSDESVATVSATGEVTAVALGEAVITASNGAVKAECKVTVVATPVESIELNLTASSLKVGEKVQLTATVSPADATDKSVTWSSSNESVVTVSATGEVTAVAIGEAVITASNGAVKAECKVTVVATPVESIELNLTASSLKVGEKVQLTATVSPADATDKTVTWRSSDELVATVSASGEVTAVALGEAVITASNGGVKAECKVTVVATPVESITIDKTAASLKVGEKVQLTATVSPADATDKSVTWSSFDESVATVSATGEVTAVALGEAIITASNGAVKAECKITVVATPVESIELNLTASSLKVGEKVQLTATVNPADATDKSVTWRSSDESVATVSATGEVSAIALGEAVITASNGAVKAECKVTVVATPVESIELNLMASSLKVGEKVQLSATVSPADATDKTVTWRSSDELVATVSASGEVTAVALGEAVITASNGGVKAECKVTVVATPVESITIDKTAASLKVGEKVQLTAAVNPADATDKTVTWRSSDELVATVSATGEVSAVALGEAVITASNGAVKAECKITVVATLVESIELNLTASSLKVGEKVQLTAAVNPADATDKTVTWGSSDESVAIVSASGEVTAVSLGEAVITASNGAVKAECKVTVVATPVESIELNLTASSLKVGDKVQLTATVNPVNATDKTVSWSSSDESVATVSATGEVTAVALGEAVITASNGTVKAECMVTVVATPVESITIDNTAASLKVGEKVQLTATVNPADATDKTVTWRSSDESVATVSATGEVTAVAPGNVEIKAEAADGSGCYAICEITVTTAESGIVAVTDSGISVVVDGCVMRITGVSEGERVRVYRENGYLVYDGYETTIDSLVRGLYIVMVGDITMKVVLN